MKCIKILLISMILILCFAINVSANEDIVLNLIEKYLDSYLTENVENNLKLKNYEIKKVNIISEEDNEIIAQYVAEITPYSENHSWATTHLYYYIKIERNNNEWRILKQQTSPFEIKYDNNNKSQNNNFEITSKTVTNPIDKDYTVSKTILPQAGNFIKKLLVTFIIIITIISLIIYYKSKT